MPAGTGFGVVLLLGLAGALGAVARFALSEWATRHWKNSFPLGTLAINASGAFVLGLLTTAGGAGSALAGARLVLGAGFLGGYTTFSTLAYDTHSLWRSGQSREAWVNALGSLASGIIAAALGLVCGTLL